MGKGDQKSRKGKISAGSFGKSRTKNKNGKSAASIPVRVLDDHDATVSKEQMRKSVGFPDEPTENAESL